MRARTGSIEAFHRADGKVYYRARIRLADGTRARVDVPRKCATDEKTRDLYALALQEREDETGELLAKKRARITQRAAERDSSRGETCTQRGWAG
jgi:hypothetical protein